MRPPELFTHFFKLIAGAQAAARLAGKLEAVMSQNAELLAVIKPPIEKVKE